MNLRYRQADGHQPSPPTTHHQPTALQEADPHHPELDFCASYPLSSPDLETAAAVEGLRMGGSDSVGGSSLAHWEI